MRKDSHKTLFPQKFSKIHNCVQYYKKSISTKNLNPDKKNFHLKKNLHPKKKPLDT
jgi:hypothetical protein